MKCQRVHEHAVIRDDVRRDATDGTGSYVLSRATAESELDRMSETASACCVFGLVVAAFAGDEDDHPDDDADADAVRSNHGAARRGSRWSALISPTSRRPRHLVVSSRFNPPSHRPSRPPSRAGPPLLYRSYGRGPLVRSICFVPVENANRARSIWTIVVRKAE